MIDRDVWAAVLDHAGEEPSFGAVVDELEDADMVDTDDARGAVEEAIAEGTLTEEDTAGMFATIRLAEPANPSKTAESDEDGGGGYRELYLRARQRSEADRALVPHEDIEPVFREAGYGDLIHHGALPRSEWTVWTPDGREKPLYAYTPDLAGDTTDDREEIADLLEAAGVEADRFIDVLDGQKASFDTPAYRSADDTELSGNYGVKGGRIDDGEYWLVDIDVDDYDDAKEANPRVEELRGETLGVASAHTTKERPGHLYVAVDGDAAAVVRDVLGREIDNPNASFGEIRIKEQYVVGPGSEIVCGCDKGAAEKEPDNNGGKEFARGRPRVAGGGPDFGGFLGADRP